jgi:hypothetical protein
MKHTITQKIEVTEEVEIITPSYRKDNANSPYYYKLTEEGGVLYVTRILILDRYQSIIKTTTISQDVIDALEITEAEYNEALNRVITNL